MSDLAKELNPSNNDNQEFFKEEYEKVQEAYKALSQSSILKNSDTSSERCFEFKIKLEILHLQGHHLQSHQDLLPLPFLPRK